MCIDDKDVARYRRDGYIVVPDVLSGQDVHDLQDATDAFVELSRAATAHTEIFDLEPGHTALQRLDPEEFARVAGGKRAAVVEDEDVREALALGAFHVREVTEGIRVREFAVLLETLPQIRSLHVVKAPRVAAVVPGEHAALRIEFHAESIAAAFGENFVAELRRMIAPDVLSLGIEDAVGVATARRDDADVRGDGAALRGVEPAIRPPTQAVHDGVRVFQTEASEMHNGIGIGDVVVVRVGIEEEVGRIQHPHASPAPHAGGGNVEAIDED